MKSVAGAIVLLACLSGCTASKESNITTPIPTGKVHRIPTCHKEAHEKLLKSQTKLVLTDYGRKTGNPE